MNEAITREGSVVVGFSFKSHGGSKITWGFEKSVGCAAFWWGTGGGMEIVVGYFPWGSVGGGRNNPISKSFINGIIIFQTKMTSL